MTAENLKHLNDFEQLLISGVISKHDVLQFESAIKEPLITGTVPRNAFSTTKSTAGYADTKRIVKAYKEANKVGIERIALPVNLNKRIYELINKYSRILRALETLEIQVNKLDTKEIPSVDRWSVASIVDDSPSERVENIREAELLSTLRWKPSTLAGFFNNNTVSVRESRILEVMNVDVFANGLAGHLYLPILSILIDGTGDYNTLVNMKGEPRKYVVGDLEKIFNNISKVKTNIDYLISSFSYIMTSYTHWHMNNWAYEGDDKSVLEFNEKTCDKFENVLVNFDLEMTIIKMLTYIIKPNN